MVQQHETGQGGEANRPARAERVRVPLSPQPIMGYVEGFIVTTNTPVEGQEPLTRDRLEALRDHVVDQPWLFPPQQGQGETEPNPEPIGKVAWGEVVPVGNGFGLWARVEFYQREALELTSAGLLGLIGLKSS
ncbi:hypothetical protein HYT17_02045 [Candidatus Microgenomates bacterium]|nr:hypothetical protein [Candidatus Microgenomates bacterium]